MTHLWDTHAFVWAVEDRDHLPAQVRTLARDGQPGDHAIADITLWEVSLLVVKGRLKLSLPLAAFFKEAAETLQILPISAAIAIRASELEKTLREKLPREAEQIFHHGTHGCAQLLAVLAKRCPERIQKADTYKERRWKISAC